jgi:hypothetical protein
MKKALIATILTVQLAMAREIHLKLVWHDLPETLKGQKVQITQDDNTILAGVLTSFNSDGLTMKTRTGDMMIPRAKISVIQTRKKLVRTKGRVIGTAVGGGIGAVILGTVMTYNNNECGVNAGALNGAAAGVAAGLGVLGYLVGDDHDRDATVIQIVPEATINR